MKLPVSLFEQQVPLFCLFFRELTTELRFILFLIRNKNLKTSENMKTSLDTQAIKFTGNFQTYFTVTVVAIPI